MLKAAQRSLEFTPNEGSRDELGQTATAPRTTTTSAISRTIGRCLTAFLEWRERAKTRAILSRLGNRELMDIGISREEIDEVATRAVRRAGKPIA